MLRHCVISNRNFGEFYDPKPYVVFQGKSSSRFTMFVLAISANNFQRTPEIIILSILSDYTFLPSENNPTNVSNKYMYTFFYINIQFIWFIRNNSQCNVSFLSICLNDKYSILDKKIYYLIKIKKNITIKFKNLKIFIFNH